MAHTNSTTHYSLPQFESSDKPAWLTDINGAFSDIDAGIYNAQDTANDAASDASQALLDAAAADSKATAADSKGAGAVASIAPAFDATATYNVGDLVMYNSLLYRCKEAISVPGAWTGSTNWARRYVSVEIPRQLGDLRNVSVGSAQEEQVLEFNGTNWVPSSQPKKNIITSISFNETYANARAYIKNNWVYITYQGEATTHSAGDTIMTIPSAYRPDGNVFIPFASNATAYGNIILNASTGQVNVNQISSATQSGRLYFTLVYPL